MEGPHSLYLTLSLSLSLYRALFLSLALPGQGRDGWTSLSLSKEEMEGPSFLYLPLALSRSLFLSRALLGQGSDGRTFLSLPSSSSPSPFLSLDKEEMDGSLSPFLVVAGQQRREMDGPHLVCAFLSF